MFLTRVVLIFVVVLVAGCASRPQVELEIVRSEVAEAYGLGAKVLAANEYDSASADLHEAETLVYRKKYSQARALLNQALLSATKAVSVAREKTVKLEKQHQVAVQVKAAVAARKAKQRVKKKIAPPTQALEPVEPEIVFLDQVTVSVGETLLSLSSRKDIYGEPSLWPLIYKANRDQIKDPKQIFEGQIFTIPRDKSELELDAARKDARESDLFPR